MIQVTSHGIEFNRSGECSQCGACGCDKLRCPHSQWKGKKHHCLIYESRGEFCEQCGMTHQACVDFPDNPWIRVVRNETCSFTFERVDEGSMDDLPFLNGEPY